MLYRSRTSPGPPPPGEFEGNPDDKKGKKSEKKEGKKREEDP